MFNFEVGKVSIRTGIDYAEDYIINITDISNKTAHRSDDIVVHIRRQLCTILNDPIIKYSTKLIGFSIFPNNYTTFNFGKHLNVDGSSYNIFSAYSRFISNIPGGFDSVLESIKNECV